MKIIRRGCSLGLLLFAGLSLGSCHDESGHWVVIDNVHAPVDSIIVSDQVAASDTLLITFVVETAWREMYSTDHIHFTDLSRNREEEKCDFEIWMNLVNWHGTFPMPPTSDGFRHEHKEPPPFTTDEFLIVVHQPDGTTLEKTVTILP